PTQIGIPAGEPILTRLDGLLPDTYYWFQIRPTGPKQAQGECTRFEFKTKMLAAPETVPRDPVLLNAVDVTVQWNAGTAATSYDVDLIECPNGVPTGADELFHVTTTDPHPSLRIDGDKAAASLDGYCFRVRAKNDENGSEGLWSDYQPYKV